MKKLMIIGLLLFMVGCTSDLSSEKELYLHMVDELKNVNESTTDLPCDIEVSLEKIGDEINYIVILDNPSGGMNNIQALVIHDQDTSDIYPSIGIFDESVSMKPETIDDNYVKGIVLSGYIDYSKDIDEFDGVIRVLISYDDISGINKTVYYKE